MLAVNVNTHLLNSILSLRIFQCYDNIFYVKYRENKQGSTGIRQWIIKLMINLNDDQLNYPFCRLILFVEKLEPTNQGLIKKFLIQRMEELVYKTLGTSIIYSPMFLCTKGLTKLN